MRKTAWTYGALFVGVTMVVLSAAPLGASSWVTADGNLSEWGVNPAGDQWSPTNVPGNVALAWVEGDDTTTAGWSSGGEWYDIEALYVGLSIYDGTEYVSWALVTSYAGVDVPVVYGDGIPNPAGNPSGYRDGTYGDQLLYPYRRHPVLALDLGTGTGGNDWDYGVIMAPEHDWYYESGGSINWGQSHGLLDQGSLVLEERDYHWGDSWTDAQYAVSSISGAPELWDVTQWRGGHPQEFGPTNPDVPVDFDVHPIRPHKNDEVAVTDAAIWAGRMDNTDEDYRESDSTGPEDPLRQMNSPWYQRDNWVWEGYVAIPTSEVDFTTNQAIQSGDWGFNCAMWCVNNHSNGDYLQYSDNPPTDPVPEPGTWILLLATGGLAGWLKRRKR